MRRDDLDRFNLLERLTHWVVGVAFVLLLLSGLALSYPSLFWLTLILGGGPAARVLHPWIGMVFTVGLILMFVLWGREMFMDARDWAWLRAVRHYARHEEDKVPPAGKYNGGQKAFFWTQCLLGVAYGLSGIALWFPTGFDAGLLTGMRLVHYLATLAGGLLLILHIYLGTIAYPGTARGMLHGKVSRSWARLHHPLWHREKTGA